MIRQKFLPTVQPSSVQKNENKENQYQMQRDPLNSATHTKQNNINNEQRSIQAEQPNETKTKKMKRRVRVKLERKEKTKNKKETNNKSKQNTNKHTNKQTKLG